MDTRFRVSRPCRVALASLIALTSFVALLAVSSSAASASSWVYHDRDMLTTQGVGVVGNYASNVKLQGNVRFWYDSSNPRNRYTSVTAGVIHRQSGTPKCLYGRIWYRYQTSSHTAGVGSEVGAEAGVTNWSVSTSMSVNSSTSTQTVTRAGNYAMACPRNGGYPRLYFSENRHHPSGLNGVLTAVYVEWGFYSGNSWDIRYDGNRFGHG